MSIPNLRGDQGLPHHLTAPALSGAIRGVAKQAMTTENRLDAIAARLATAEANILAGAGSTKPTTTAIYGQWADLGSTTEGDSKTFSGTDRINALWNADYTTSSYGWNEFGGGLAPNAIHTMSSQFDRLTDNASKSPLVIGYANAWGSVFQSAANNPSTNKYATGFYVTRDATIEISTSVAAAAAGAATGDYCMGLKLVTASNASYRVTTGGYEDWEDLSMNAFKSGSASNTEVNYTLTSRIDLTPSDELVVPVWEAPALVDSLTMTWYSFATTLRVIENV